MKAIDPASQLRIVGIELSAETAQSCTSLLHRLGAPANIFCRDFFDCSPEDIGQIDVVVGNPPFIRFHRFAGAARERALARAREAGVEMSALTSSWAPFLVHAARFVGTGGRMAVVAPGELAYASYAQPLVRHLCDSFSDIKILVFRKRLFPELSEETVLLLAEGKGVPFQSLTLHCCDDAESLPTVLDAGIKLERPVRRARIERLTEHLIPAATRDLYRELCLHEKVCRLGQVADVGIGYVTGNNAFFHLTAAQRESFSIPQRFVAPCIRRISEAPGLFFTRHDWTRLTRSESPNLLLNISPRDRRLPPGLQRYLRKGIAAGVHKGYKCRNREPWHSVPHVYIADAFLSYMSGRQPRLVINSAKAVAPNTLHIARLSATAPVSRAQLAIGWNSALTALSCEIEGHSLGGGLLKVEPGEAERIAVPIPKDSRDVAAELDAIARSMYSAELGERADRELRVALGLSKSDVQRLRTAAELLTNRRRGR